jgi:hypothetical protein
MRIMTASWFTPLDLSRHQRIGVSRGVPRGQSGFRRFMQLNPGAWFNHVTPERYLELYQSEILSPLDPGKVVEDLHKISNGKIPTLLCWEPPTPGENWCHRGIIAAWLKDNLRLDVFEFGQEIEGSGWQHPKLHPRFRRSGCETA